MRYLLYLPGIILILVPILAMRHAAKRAEQARREQEAERAAAAEQRRIEAERKQAIQQRKAAEREAAKAAREAEQQRKQAARLEAARQRAEYAERELAAKREAKALERGEIIPTEPEQPEAPADPVSWVYSPTSRMALRYMSSFGTGGVMALPICVHSSQHSGVGQAVAREGVLGVLGGFSEVDHGAAPFLGRSGVSYRYYYSVFKKLCQALFEKIVDARNIL